MFPIIRPLEIMSSSLQRATSEPSKGDFERCFAGGLDLSEFARTSTSTSSHNISHAAALLNVKQQEAKKKQLQESEEINFQKAIQERSELLRNMTKTPDTRSASTTFALTYSHDSQKIGSSFLGGVIADLHDTDKHESRRTKRTLLRNAVKHDKPGGATSKSGRKARKKSTKTKFS